MRMETDIPYPEINCVANSDARSFLNFVYVFSNVSVFHPLTSEAVYLICSPCVFPQQGSTIADQCSSHKVW